MVDFLPFAVPRLLDLLDPPARTALLRAARRQTFRAGQLIHQRGDDEAALGIVLTGTVDLLRRGPDGRTASEASVSSGEHYGDLALLDPTGQRTHEARAATDCHIAVVPRAAFEALVKNEPKIVAALYRIAMRRLAVSLDLLDDARTLRPIARISKVLTYAMDAAGGHPLIKCRQEDIAQLLGLSGVTVSTALAELQRRGVIELGYRNIRVINRHRLSGEIPS